MKEKLKKFMAIGIWDTIYNFYKSYTRSNSSRVEEVKKETPLEKETSEIYNIPPQKAVVEDLKTPFSEEPENSNPISQNEAVDEIEIEKPTVEETSISDLAPQIELVQEIQIEEPIVEETNIADLEPQIESVQEIEIENPIVEETSISDFAPQIESVQEIEIEKPIVEETNIADLTPQIESVQEIEIESPIVEETNIADLAPQIELVQEIEIENPIIEETNISDLAPQIELVQEIEIENPIVEETNIADLAPQIESVQEIEIEKSTGEETNIADLTTQTEVQEQPDLVTVEEEMNSVEQYLASEKERLGEKLNYSLDIEQESFCQKIPPIIIQTLVENAVKHGIQETTEGGYVNIQSFVYDGFLTIEIKNSGQLNNETVSFETSESGIYIENTIKRLASLFGDNGFFSIENDGENEVVATVCVPVISC